MGAGRKAAQAMFERNKWRILRGDKVMVMAGKDRGQVGTVLKVLRDPDFPRVVVEGLNLSKRHIKRTKDNPGGIVSVESPLHYSNVSLLDPMNNQPCRVAWRYTEGGDKVRVTVGKLATGSIIPRPEVLKQRRKPRNTGAGPGDTAEADAAEVTHTPGDLPSLLKQQLAAAAAAKSAGAGAQQRQYSTAAAAAAADICGSLLCGRGGVLGSAPRLLGGSMRSGHWRGFAAGATL
ncbi:hypothetical protein ABPG75_012936 [Micractinium tetrahymenae]